MLFGGFGYTAAYMLGRKVPCREPEALFPLAQRHTDSSPFEPTAISPAAAAVAVGTKDIRQGRSNRPRITARETALRSRSLHPWKQGRGLLRTSRGYVSRRIKGLGIVSIAVGTGNLEQVTDEILAIANMGPSLQRLTYGYAAVSNVEYFVHLHHRYKKVSG